MDIRIVIQRSIIYAILASITIGVYILFVLISGATFGDPANSKQFFAGLFSVVFLVFTIPVVNTVLKKLTDPIFFKDAVNYTEALNHVHKLTELEVSTKSLLPKVLSVITDEFKVGEVSFVFCEKVLEGKCLYYFTHGDRKGNEYLPVNTRLIQYFKKRKRGSLLIAEDFERDIPMEGITTSNKGPILDELKRLRASLCISVLHNSSIHGFLCVSEKKSGDPFFSKDIEWFEIIAGQLGLALERASIYEHLEELVADRTEERREVNNKLQQMVEAKSEFVSVASHQLQTPLAVIKSVFSLLRSEQLGKLRREQADFVNRGFLQSQKLLDLIEKFLIISRVEAGRITLNLDPDEIMLLIREQVALLSQKAKDKGLEIAVAPPERPIPPFLFDGKLMGEVVLNLLDNAIKYTPSGGITIHAQRDEDVVRVTISDTGVGLTEEGIRQLFNRFVTNVGKRTMAQTGTGIGLYFARRVIEAHGGRIWAESGGENKGSTFIFEIPFQTKK